MNNRQTFERLTAKKKAALKEFNKHINYPLIATELWDEYTAVKNEWLTLGKQLKLVP